MPAQRLGGLPTSIRKYDVAAQDSDNKVKFIQHVGLSEDDRDDIRWNTQISLAHMGPPLRRGDRGYPIHAIGTANLTVGQCRQIDVFIDEQRSEYEAEKIRRHQQYVIHPHVREPDAEVSCRRFSCAGFVIVAYQYAGIDLVITDPDLLPTVSLETLSQAYPRSTSRLQDPDIRIQYGLKGDPPWPVVLAGYVMNALDRPSEEIRREPYQPVAGDEFFPSQRENISDK
jgi:hypothetical protein